MARLTCPHCGADAAALQAEVARLRARVVELEQTGEALALLAELEHMDRGEWLAARLARTVVAIHRERAGAEERARAKCVAECDRLINAAEDFGRRTYYAGASDAKIAAYREGIKMCRDALRVLSVSEPAEAGR